MKNLKKKTVKRPQTKNVKGGHKGITPICDITAESGMCIGGGH